MKPLSIWPFKKRRPHRPLPFAEDLNPAEVIWLDDLREALTTLSLTANLPTPTPDHTLEAADALIRWWHDLPDDAKIDANLVVNSAGVALGDALAAALGMHWKIITDQFGTDLGLWWTPPTPNTSRGSIILSPTHSVAKKFAHSPDGFVVTLFKHMVPDTEAIKQNMSAPQ